jgi:hypothetical protein
MRVNAEEHVTLKKQQASNDLSLVGVSFAKCIYHLLAESVFLGVGADREALEDVLFEGISAGLCLGSSSAMALGWLSMDCLRSDRSLGA